jgi:hypothetical protein
MATEDDWNGIQARQHSHSWLRNVSHGRQTGIQLPYEDCDYLQPEQKIRQVDIHFPQVLNSYYSAIVESQDKGYNYLQASFPADVFTESLCICDIKSANGDDCDCGAISYPLLDTLVGNHEGRIETNRLGYQWAVDPNQSNQSLSASNPVIRSIDSKYNNSATNVPMEMTETTETMETMETTATMETKVPMTKSVPSEVPPRTMELHAQQQNYHAVVNYLCIRNITSSPLLPAPVAITIATQAKPTFNIDADINDADLGRRLKHDWKTWQPVAEGHSSPTSFGLPTSGFVADIGQNNRVSDPQCHDLAHDIQLQFDKLIEEFTSSPTVHAQFHREVADEINSDLPVEYGLRHLIFHASVTPINLEFYQHYANLDIIAYVQRLLDEPFQYQQSSVILVPCDTQSAEPGVAPSEGMHLISTFIREFIQYATPDDKLSVSKSYCPDCGEAPSDRLHYHQTILEPQLQCIQVNSSSSMCFRFDRRRFLRVLNVIITFLNNRLINLSGGIQIRVQFQTPKSQEKFLDIERSRLKAYDHLLQTTHSITDLPTQICHDQYRRLFEPGHWLSSIEMRMGCMILRPNLRVPEGRPEHETKH